MGYYKHLHTIYNGKNPYEKRKTTKKPPKPHKQNKTQTYRPKYKPIYTHSDIIEYFSQENISILAYYYKLKQHYKNSTIYNWSSNKISRRCKISYYTAKKYSKELIHHGLAEEHKTSKGTHLFLKSMKQIYTEILNKKYNKGWVEINITYKDKLNNIKDKLRNVVTYKHIKCQNFAFNLKRDNLILASESHSDEISLSRAKRILKIRNESPEVLENGRIESNFIGMRRLGSILNLSHGGARKFLSRLEESKQVVTKPYYRFVKKIKGLNRPEDYSEAFPDYPGWFYRTRGGKIGVIFGTKIEYPALQPLP